jgi:hypothetical protein
VTFRLLGGLSCVHAYDDDQHLPRTDRRLFAKAGKSMPLFTVTMRSGRTVTEKDAISAAIHEASVSAGYPEDDHFQRFISLEEADLRISSLYRDLQKPRSEHVLMIEVLVSSETGADRKRLLLSAIATRQGGTAATKGTPWHDRGPATAQSKIIYYQRFPGDVE